MIVAAELQMQGNKHVGVNSSMLKILDKSTSEGITVYCDEFHRESLEKNFIFSHVNWNTFRYTKERELKKINIPFKVIREVFLALSIFRFAKKNKAEVIFFFSSYPFTQFFLNLLAIVFQQKIILCQHGDLGVLSLQHPKVLSKVFGWVQRLFFKFRSSNSIVLFYGESIKEVFFKKFPNYSSNNVICIDHPYDFDTDKLISIKRNPLVVSGIGTGLINKNSHYIYKLASFFSEEIKGNKIKFQHIGNMSNEVKSFQNELVSDMGDGRFMDRETFENQLVNSSMFIYFFEENSLYDLCPSGTFFDAIKYEKPIISFKNPFFKHYFDKIGEIGWQFDNIDDIKDFLFYIINLDDTSFLKITNMITTNLQEGKSILSLDEIEKKFLIQLKKYAK